LSKRETGKKVKRQIIWSGNISLGSIGKIDNGVDNNFGQMVLKALETQ